MKELVNQFMSNYKFNMKISKLQEILELVKSREGDLNVVKVKSGIITEFSFEVWTDILEKIAGLSFVLEDENLYS